MHLAEPSMGGDTANIMHSSSIMTSAASAASAAASDNRHVVQSLLFQPVWRAEHLKLLKVKEKTQIAAAAIVGKFNLPKDGRDDFEDLSNDLTEATPSDILSFTTTEDQYHHNPFWPVFSSLYTITTHPSSTTSQNRYVRAAKAATRHLIETSLPYADDEGSLRLEMNSVPFHLRKAGVRGTLACDGCIIKMDLQSGAPPLPVVAVSVVRPSESREEVEAQEASQLVLQAALAWEADPTLTVYKAFAIHVDGTRLQVVSADISRVYLERLYQVSCPDGFDVLHSASYDLLEVDGRREALRIVLGLLKSLRSKPVRRPF